MTIEKSFENSKLTITVSGKLNTITSQQFAEELKDLDGVTELVLDFAELEQITSAGLRVLLDVQCNMTDRKGTMVVKNVNSIVHEVFVLTGFINFLTIE